MTLCQNRSIKSHIIELVITSVRQHYGKLNVFLHLWSPLWAECHSTHRSTTSLQQLVHLLNIRENNLDDIF